MAAPTTLTATWKYVVITTTSAGGIVPTTPNVVTGIVEQIGANVTKAYVGEYVMFKADAWFSNGTNTWAIVHEDNIYSSLTLA
jgi:hypothetical protein